MKTSDRFNKAISALVQAFFNETLAKGSCTACAVGSIIAANIGATIEKKSFQCDMSLRPWIEVFATNGETGHNEINEDAYVGRAKVLIDSTGYSWQELSSVENAFEVNTKISFSRYRFLNKEQIMEDQYNGLMAVVDVLCNIEGIESNETKKLFEHSIQ